MVFIINLKPLLENPFGRLGKNTIVDLSLGKVFSGQPLLNWKHSEEGYFLGTFLFRHGNFEVDAFRYIASIRLCFFLRMDELINQYWPIKHLFSVFRTLAVIHSSIMILFSLTAYLNNFLRKEKGQRLRSNV